MRRVNLKPGDLVRWLGPMAPGFIGKTAVVNAIHDGNPNTLSVVQSALMTSHGLGTAWGSVPEQWEVVDKVNPYNEWGEEGL